MSIAEEQEEGMLNVDLNYIKLAQEVENAMCFLQHIKSILDIAAIEKGMKDRERRNGDRRKL